MTLNSSPLQRFGELHTALYARFHKNNFALQAVNSGMSVVCYEPESAFVFAYVRLHSEAQSVERLIGLRSSEIDLQRHPLIELRLTEQHFALEFVLSPLAWWDQRNLIGKLSIRRHREELRDLLLSMSPEMIVGHWLGTRLDDQHLSLRHLHSPRVMDAWLQTFADGQDPIRIGRWFSIDMLNEDIMPELFETAKSLYALYRFLAWTGRNDFQSFYDQPLESR